LEHIWEGDFRTVVGIRKVLRGRKNDGDAKKAMSAQETGDPEKRVINPTFPLRCNGKLRLDQAEHAVVISELNFDPNHGFFAYVCNPS
jgi:hypothetical protein